MAEWLHFNPSPVARNVGDCAVRALSKALSIDWEAAYATLAMSGFLMADMPSSNAVMAAILRKNGFYRHIIPNKCPDCYTIEDFADEHPNGVYVVGTGEHVVTIEDGIVYDSWDSRREIPIYYWSTEVND